MRSKSASPKADEVTPAEAASRPRDQAWLRRHSHGQKTCNVPVWCVAFFRHGSTYELLTGAVDL